VDFLRDTANLKVYYDDPNSEGWLHDSDSEVVIVSKEES